MDIAVLDGVSFGYWRRSVFAGVNVRVGPGVTGLLGPNGAGKSSLLSLLATRRSPAVGELSVLGENVLRESGREQVRRQLGYLQQHYSLVGSMRVLDTVAYAAWAQGRPQQACFDDALAALSLVELDDLVSRRVRTLSGGQRQRVGLAAAMVHRPELLLLDEPTSGLDPQVRLAIRRTLRGLARFTSIVMSTHLVDDVGALCDDVVVLDKGTVVFDGAVAGLEARGSSGLAGGVDGDDATTALERGYMRLLESSRSRA